MSKEIQVRRAKRGDLAAIAALVQKATHSRVQVGEADVIDWLFSKGLWVAIQGDSLVGVAAWQAENLLSVTDVLHVSPARLQTEAGGRLLETLETEANVLMCEANVVVLPTWISEAVRTFLQAQGYEPRQFRDLHRIWREVLSEFVADDSDLMVKRLRERMVMVPL